MAVAGVDHSPMTDSERRSASRLHDLTEPPRPNTEEVRGGSSDDRRNESSHEAQQDATATHERRSLSTNLSVDDQGGLPRPPTLVNEGQEHWLRSPFAVGPTNATWAEENVDCCKLYRSIVTRSEDVHLHFTAFLCSRTGAGRVGNMVVLWQRWDEVQGRVQPPRLILVLGPFWMVCCFVTLPFFLAFSSTVFFCRIAKNPCLGLLAPWIIVQALVLVALLCVCCRDPGILERHNEPRVDDSGQQYAWSSQANTYRPLSARYDPECGAVIDEFHHTCPWVGTAIGRRNRLAFMAFVVLAVVGIAFNVLMFLLPSYASTDF
jgi:DHHC palmitoyltransferase